MTYVKIVGTICAIHEQKGHTVERPVRSFVVPSDTPWVNIVDEATERTFPEACYQQFEENLNEEMVS